MSRRHLSPVEVEGCVEVPQRPVGPLASLVTVQEDAAGSGHLYIIYKFLDQQVVDHQGDVHHFRQRIVVVGEDGVFEGGERFAGKPFGLIPLPLLVGGREFDAHRQAIHLRPEIILCPWRVLRTVVHVEGQQHTFLFVDIHTALALLHLFGELVEPLVVAVERQFHIPRMVREGDAEPFTHLEDEGVHQICRVTVVGQQHPVLVCCESEYLRFLVELQAIGLLRIPLPGGVAASTDAPPPLVVPDGSVALYLDGAATVVGLLLAGDGHVAVHVDADLCHAVLRGEAGCRLRRFCL